jgi:hypothetical protein
MKNHWLDKRQENENSWIHCYQDSADTTTWMSVDVTWGNIPCTLAWDTTINAERLNWTFYTTA